MRTILSLMLCALIISGCGDDDATLPVITGEPSLVMGIPVPSSGKVGDRVKIPIHTENINRTDLFFYIDDLLFVTVDSITNDAVYSFIPFMAGKSSYKVGMSYSLNDSLYSAETEIYITQPIESGIHIMQSDEPELTEADVYYHDGDPSMAEKQKWQTELKGDTVILSKRTYLSGDIYHYEEVKLLDNGNGSLPQILSAIAYTLDEKSTTAPIHISSLTSGVLKIDKWQSGETYAGILYPNLAAFGDNLPAMIRFWGKL